VIREKHAREKELVEHPFAIIKHHMNHDYFLMRGMKNVCGRSQHERIGLQYETCDEHCRCFNTDRSTSSKESIHSLRVIASPATDPFTLSTNSYSDIVPFMSFTQSV